jgi:hypothetical protein
MSVSTASQTVLFILLAATIAAGADKTQRVYQKGSITGYDNRLDLWLEDPHSPRRATVYELKGADYIYKIDYCSAFQAGQFTIGQAVDYRLDGDRLYIRHDVNKEYKCKIEGTRVPENAKSGSQ